MPNDPLKSDKSHSSDYPEGFFDLFGSLADDPLEVPEELPWSLDTPIKFPEEDRSHKDHVRKYFGSIKDETFNLPERRPRSLNSKRDSVTIFLS